jgi:two-component system CheB/CheR fusion protein
MDANVEKARRLPTRDRSPALPTAPPAAGTARHPLRARTLPAEDAARDEERLRAELAVTRECLQSVIEQQEVANEELQIVNEELETSKQEIQAGYEELTTVADELRYRNAELGLLNNDLFNLLGSVEMAIVILDCDLRVRRFTPQAEKVLRLIPADLGRPIVHHLLTLGLPDFEPLLREVLTTDSIRECELRAPEGRWYSLRVRPYRTLENQIDGAVILLVDIDTVRRAREYAESIVAAMREPLLVLDQDLRVQTANPAFYRAFQLTPEETEKRFLHELGDGQWDLPELRRRLAELPAEGNDLPGFEMEREFPRIGRRALRLNARRLLQEDGWSALTLLAVEDITGRKQLEAALQQRRAELAAAERGRNELLALLNVHGEVLTRE